MPTLDVKEEYFNVVCGVIYYFPVGNLANETVRPFLVTPRICPIICDEIGQT